MGRRLARGRTWLCRAERAGPYSSYPRLKLQGEASPILAGWSLVSRFEERGRGVCAKALVPRRRGSSTLATE